MERAYELQQIFLSFSDTLGQENTAFQRIKSTRYRPFIQGLRMFLKAYLHGTTLSHATSLRQAYDMT